MRTDNVTTYVLPTLEAAQNYLDDQSDDADMALEKDEKKLEYSSLAGDVNECAAIGYDTTASLTLDLIPLPLLTEQGDQTPIGARGWYSSAVLSSMLLSGHKVLTRDIMQSSTSKTNRIMIELGSGTLGLCGMTLAWVVAQQQQAQSAAGDNDASQTTSTPPSHTTRVVLTDYDADVLQQLEINSKDADKRLQQYFGNASHNMPKIEAAKLDWNEYDKAQQLLDCDDNPSEVTFVCGAALVYCDETANCSYQINKILQQSPNAAIWIVQWPRKGWFSVLQQQLVNKFRLKVEKFAIDEIHPSIHSLARQFMPPQLELNVDHIKAIRITSPDKVE